MTNLSLTQEYVLCSLTENGKIPSLETEMEVCILAAGLMELLNKECIRLNEKKQLIVIAELPKERAYLQSLYDWLKESKPMTVDKIAEEFSYNLNGKKLRVLTNAVGDALVAAGCATFEKGKFGKKHYYIPDSDAVDEVIDLIQAQILEKKDPVRKIYMLTSLLEKSHQLKRYFDKYDRKQIVIRKREIYKSFPDAIQTQIDDARDLILTAVMAVTEWEQ